MKCTIKRISCVDMTKGRTGCRVEGFIHMPNQELIPDTILKWIFNYGGVNVEFLPTGLKVSSWASTTCSENDTFDKSRGAHIAESKAKAKIYRFLAGFSASMSAYLESLANDFDDTALKYDHCVDHEESHLNFLGDRPNN